MDSVVPTNRLEGDKSPSMSIIIPTFNSEGTIGKCLLGVLSQDYPTEKIEVIVIDSGKDSTQEICKSLNIEYINTYWSNEKRLTAGEARNLGIAHAHGDFIVTLDSDCVPQKDWLRRAVADLREFPEAGGVYCPFGGGTNIMSKWLNHEYDFNRKALYYLFNGAETGLVVKKIIFDSGARFGESPLFEGLSLYGWMNKRAIPILIDNSIRINHLKQVRVTSWMKRHFSMGRSYAINEGIYAKGIIASLLVVLSLFALPLVYITPVAILPFTITTFFFSYFEIMNKVRYNELAPLWVKFSLGLVGVICKWIFWTGYIIQIIFKPPLGYYKG